MTTANTNGTETQTIWIVRHGERIDTIKPAWRNDAERPHDPHLSEKGVTQAQAVGQRLIDEDIAHIFASPFYRTVETASHIAESLDLSIKIEHGLGEWLQTVWFKSRPEVYDSETIREYFPQVDPSYVSQFEMNYPETWEQIIDRTAKTIQYLTDQFDGNLLIVGHGASTTGVAYGLVGDSQKIDMDVCALTKIVQNHGENNEENNEENSEESTDSWTLELNGDKSHLPEQKPAYV